MLPLLLLAALLRVGASSRAAPPTAGPAVQPADPAATVRWGAARFTVLTPRLLRLELAGRGGFDDRPSLAVLSRRTPVPAFTVSPSGDALTLTTSALTLVYAPAGGNASAGGGGNSTCALAARGFDVADGARVAAYPFGANASSQAACCALCDAEPTCTAWIFALDGGAPNCWLMRGVTALTPQSQRVTGAVLPFSAADLNVTFSLAGKPAVWTPAPAAADVGNLRGAFHALDCYDKPANCIAAYAAGERPGLISRSGFALLDDSAAARLVPPAPGVPSPLPYWYANATALRPAADWYLFAHGREFRAALADYVAIGGAPALAPVAAYGTWWSHWEAFSQELFTDDILGGYRNHSLPLNFISLDVDWHAEFPGNSTLPSYSYGGYTVNTDLWPAWSAFLASLADGTNPTGFRDIGVVLNLHPQGGTDAWQKYWPAFQAAIGGWTNMSQVVPCMFGDQRVAAASFSAFMDVAELAPIPAWWSDYDADGDCFSMPEASTPSSFPIGWSNEVFAGHARLRGRRPMVLSRSGGLGAHRHPVTFTGDANQHQDILGYELAATPRAANALAVAVSHDIGGFMCNSINQSECSGDPQLWSNSLLYLRWLQAGVSLPIMRTHASEWGLSVMERRVWMFPANISGHMADALRLRSALGPYIYTEARRAHDTGVAPVHPLYYDFPEADEAYAAAYATQYMSGSVLLASPIWRANETTAAGSGEKTTWLPPGSCWCDWNASAACVQGPAVVTRAYGLADTPLFVPAGAVLPMKTNASVAGAVADPLVLAVWPPAPGAPSAAAYELYEDDGSSNDYEAGAFATTTISASFSALAPAGSTLTVSPPAGAGFAGAPATRAIVARFFGFAGASGLPAPSAVAANGAAVPAGAPGCAAPCFYVVPPALHSLLAPEGTLVVAAGTFAVHAQTQIVVLW